MAAMSATICAWIFQTAMSSGTKVTQPRGPGGSASVPDAIAALAAAAFATARARAAGVRLLVSAACGIRPMKFTIVAARLFTVSAAASGSGFLRISNEIVSSAFGDGRIDATRDQY